MQTFGEKHLNLKPSNMDYYFIGQLLEAVFAAGGMTVFVWAMWDFFRGETDDSPFEAELDFIPKSLKRHF